MAVLAATLLATSPAAADHGGEHPTWECDGVPLLMRGGRLYDIVPDPTAPGELTVEVIPGASGIWNSTAHDPTTGYVYGVGSIGGVHHIRAYDANADIVFETPIQAPYPAGASVYAGTVLGDGRYIIHSVGRNDGSTGWYAGARFNLWSIDPATGAAAHIGPTNRNLADIAYNPLDGFVYHITNRLLYKVNPNDGTYTTTAMPGAFPGGGFGSSWFDAAGFLYVFRNNPGDIFRVDVNDPTTWSEVGEVGADGGTDGTSCVSQVDLKKDVVNGATPVVLGERVYSPGDTVTYSYTLVNNGVPTMGLTSDLCDVLPNGFTYTGAWASSHPSATLTNGGTGGDGDFCLRVEVPSSLWTDPDTPGEDPVVITFDVAIPDNAVPGEYENQATLDYNLDGTPDLVSDDPGDGSEPRDPTTVQVTGQFEISKTVVGHPDGNDTDSFTMTVACTTADGAAVTIAASDIVDDATGTPWPGAGAGTFTISHNQTLRVENLPAGATCVTTETVPGSYSVAPTSSDGTTSANSATLTIDGAPGTESVGFVNETGVLTIAKATNSTSVHPVDPDATFTFDVKCDSGFTDTYSITTTGGTGTLTHPDTALLPAGDSCTVTETPPSGWTNPSGKPVTVTIDAVGPVTAGFKNVRQFADLTVTKSILGLPSSGDPDDFEFDITVRCTNGFDPDPYTVAGPLTVSTARPLTVAALPVGAECTVTETAVGGFVTTYTPGQTVTIEPGGATVDITNATGSLVVKKDTEVVSDLPVNLVETFDYQIVCTRGPDTVYDAIQSLTTSTPTATGTTGGITWGDLPLIPNGAQCTVTELGPPTGWTVTTPAVGNDVDITVTPLNPEPTAEFVNQRDVASLTVNKAIVGAPAAWSLDDEEFTVDVVCTGDFEPSPVTIADQVVTVNTPLVIDGIPTGSTCAVTEDADDRFAAAYSPANGDGSAAEVIIGDGGGAATVTNTTATLALSKTTASASGLDLITDDTFTFDIVCVNGADIVFTDTVSITTTSGTGTAATVDMPLVAPGTDCTVTEQGPPAGWTLVGRSGGTTAGTNGITVATEVGANPASFTNELDLATLTITKDVTGTPVTADVEDDVFVVNVTCTGDFASGSQSFGPFNLSEGAPVTVTGLPAGAQCTVVETTDDRFSTSYDPAQTVTVVTEPTPGQNAVQVTNTTATLSVTKTTTAPVGVEANDTFTFDVECRNSADVAIFTGSFSITTVDGTGTWGSPDSPLLPIGATCAVAEQTPPSGWTLTSPSPTSVTISATETVEAMFTNARSVAPLTVTKTLIGIPDDLNFDDEEFLVDISCTGDFSSSPLTLPSQALTHNAPVVIPNLPTGAVCTITEQFDSRFQTLYSPDNGGGTSTIVTIGEDGAVAGITNAGGTLIIRKSTVEDSEHPIDLLVDVDYDIRCSAPGDGVYTLSVEELAGEEGIGGLTYTELPVIPDGSTCTISEIVPVGWAVSANPVEVTVSAAAGPQTASFINTRQVADLTIDKQLVGVPAGTDLGDEAFMVDISCSGGFTVDPYLIEDQIVTANTDLVIRALPVGAACTVSEEADARFTTSYGPAATVVVDTDGTTVTVTNETSTFAISKATTVPTTHPVISDDTFTFDIACDGPGGSALYTNSVAVTTATSAGSWGSPDAPLLPPGTTCEITERALNGWTNTTAATREITTTSADVETAAFTNERDTDSLTITKTIIGLPDGVDLDDLTFPVNVVCTGDFTTSPYTVGTFPLSVDTPIVIDDLPTGASCTAVEATDQRFAAAYDPDDATTVIGDGGSRIGIDNMTGTFDLSKTITVDGTQPIDLSATFTFDVTCTNGAAFTLTLTSDADGNVAPLSYPDVPLVADGEACTIAEQGPPAGWAVVGDASREVVITFNDIPEIVFANHRQTGDLTLTKAVLGAPDGLNPDTITFTVDVSCTGDFASSPLVFSDLAIGTTSPATISNLPTGATCTFVEDYDSRFTPTYSPVDSAGPGGQVAITATGGTGSIINSTGEIMVVKVTEVDSGFAVDLNEAFDFNVNCGTAHIGDYTITTSTVLSPTSATGVLSFDDLPALPNGATCTVTEAATPPGWTLATALTVDLTVDSDLIGADAPTATFVNRRDVGALTVSKELGNVPDGVDLTAEEFLVDVTCTGTFIGGSVNIDDLAVSVDAPGIVDRLPTGSECSVTEQADPRFSAATTGETIISNTGGSITVTNTTSTLSIDKTTTGPLTHPIDLDAEFTWSVTCVDPGGSPAYEQDIGLSTDGGVARWDTTTTPLLPPGSKCEITEQDANGWTLLSNNPQTVTTVDNGIVSAAFENSRDTGALLVTKHLHGVPDDVDLSAEEFTVNVVCQGGYINDADLTLNRNFTATSAVKIVDLPTGTVCEATETADPRFTTTYQPDTASVTVTADGDHIEVHNATGAIEIQKITSADSNLPVDVSGVFAFTTVCDNGLSATHQISVEDELNPIIGPRQPGGPVPDYGGMLPWGQLGLQPTGTLCEISEVDLPDGWEPVGDTTLALTVEPGITTATFENSRQTVPFTINKTIVGAPPGAELDDEVFDVSIVCTGDFVSGTATVSGQVSVNDPLVIDGVPTAAVCTTAEEPDARFATTYAPSSAEVEVISEAASLEIVNATSSLAIAKNVSIKSQLPIELDGSFGFDLVCDNGLDTTIVVDVVGATSAGGNGTTTYPDVPLIGDGSSCTVTEHATTGWEIVGDDKIDVEVVAGEVAEARFTNERQTGALTVTKQLADTPDRYSTTAFPITVTCDGDFPDGRLIIPGPLSIATDEPAIVEGIPTGSTCTVTEDPGANFRVGFSHADGTITIAADTDGADGSVEFQVTNTYIGGQVGAAGESPRTLAFTGSNGSNLIFYGVGLVLVGVLVLLRRPLLPRSRSRA